MDESTTVGSFHVQRLSWLDSRSNIARYAGICDYSESISCSKNRFGHLGFPLFRSYQTKESQTNCELQALDSELRNFM